MNRPESIVVGFVLGVACPLLTFVVFWWTTAAIHLHLGWLPLEAVIASALGGLALGVVLDVVYLKRWIDVFYTANVWLLGAIYLGLCVAAVACFMGLPVGTFLLGIGSGLYMGRRQRHVRPDDSSATTPSLRATAVFAALVTTAAALPIGLLALADRSVRESLARLPGLGRADLGGFAGLTLVGILCLILFVAQYWCCRVAGQWSLAIGGTDGRPGDKPGCGREATAAQAR
ncbi:MAG: hypothetical protein JXB62_21540 [Pirellulales bacterium]|nr:hypothetical protein [Pirellulales bacterium]